MLRFPATAPSLRSSFFVAAPRVDIAHIHTDTRNRPATPQLPTKGPGVRLDRAAVQRQNRMRVKATDYWWALLFTAWVASAFLVERKLPSQFMDSVEMMRKVPMAAFPWPTRPC